MKVLLTVSELVDEEERPRCISLLKPEILKEIIYIYHFSESFYVFSPHYYLHVGDTIKQKLVETAMTELVQFLSYLISRRLIKVKILLQV